MPSVWIECVYCHKRRYGLMIEHLIWVCFHRLHCRASRHEEKVKDTRMVCPVCGASAICLNCKPKVN